jgi:hypothetical protein
VVLLDHAVAKHTSILRANLGRDPLKSSGYVGVTGLPVNHRSENHKNSYKSAWVFRKYRVRLMSELYEHLNPMPFVEFPLLGGSPAIWNKSALDDFHVGSESALSKF